MSNGEFFGDLTRQAEIDLCAANYLRHRIEMASVAVQKMLDGLEAHAQEFWTRGEDQLRALVPDGTSEDLARAQSEMFLSYLSAHLGKSEPGPDRIALCNRMIVDAGASNELQTILWLIGEDLVLPMDHESGAGARRHAGGQPTQPATPREATRSATGQRPRADADAARQGAANDEFFGVKVPKHEREKARLIVADARERAVNEGHYANSPYVAARGLNAWQQKLLKAAFAKAMEENRGRQASAVPDKTQNIRSEVQPQARARAVTAGHGQLGEDGVGAEPVEEHFGEDSSFAADQPEAAEVEDLFPEPLDDDDAPVLTEPLQPMSRPQPTVFHQTPVSRDAPPPVRQSSGSGLMTSNVKPAFLPPSRSSI